MAWALEATTTLGSSGDAIDTTIAVSKKFYTILSHALKSGAITLDFHYNNNTGTVYARRKSTSGGADGTDVSATLHEVFGGAAFDTFSVGYMANITGEEKLIITHAINPQAAGAGTAPQRGENVAKFVPSPDADVTAIDIDNNDIGSYDTSSNISVLGTD